MDRSRLQDDFLAELAALEKSGAVLPFHLRPSEAWYVLSVLQLDLRNPALRGGQMRDFLDSLARNIEGRLCKGRPAMTEVARMGWNPEYDEAAAERRTGGNPAAESPLEPPAEPEPEAEAAAAETAKRKPERTPDNKQLDVPENKALGKRKRK